uniref:DBP48 n=1 Tax=synthetic construct TaxID=32630 RepID=UPI00355C9ED4
SGMTPEEIAEAKRIGKEVKERRKELGLTQRELAEKLGVSRSTVSDIENGRRLPSEELLKKIKEILGVGSG